MTQLRTLDKIQKAMAAGRLGEGPGVRKTHAGVSFPLLSLGLDPKAATDMTAQLAQAAKTPGEVLNFWSEDLERQLLQAGE